MVLLRSKVLLAVKFCGFTKLMDLLLVESRIHRLARYYKKTKKLPPVWKYESTTAGTLVA